MAWRNATIQTMLASTEGLPVDTDLHPPLSVNPPRTDGAEADEAARASAIIGSETFVERVLSCMTLGARKAAEENAAVKTLPTTP